MLTNSQFRWFWEGYNHYVEPVPTAEMELTCTAEWLQGRQIRCGSHKHKSTQTSTNR